MSLKWLFVWYPPWLRPVTEPIDRAPARFPPPPSREDILRWIQRPMDSSRESPLSRSRSPTGRGIHPRRDDSRSRTRSTSPENWLIINVPGECVEVHPLYGGPPRRRRYPVPHSPTDSSGDLLDAWDDQMTRDPLCSPTSPADWGPRGAGGVRVGPMGFR